MILKRSVYVLLKGVLNNWFSFIIYRGCDEMLVLYMIETAVGVQRVFHCARICMFDFQQEQSLYFSDFF